MLRRVEASRSANSAAGVPSARSGRVWRDYAAAGAAQPAGAHCPCAVLNTTLCNLMARAAGGALRGPLRGPLSPAFGRRAAQCTWSV